MITLQTTFIDNINMFLKTICIKNDYFAQSIKEEYMYKHQLDELDDIHNPYYLNICGELSPDQTPIKVVSIDTAKLIDFTKKNLKSNSKTKYSYRIGSNKYLELCKDYPNYVGIINSTLLPAIEEELLPYTDDTEKLMRELIDKKNYSLLAYDDTLLDENEKYSIINRIIDTLTMIRGRFDVSEFVYETNYAKAMWVSVAGILYLAIVTQRICNIKTDKALLSQVWEYLISHGLHDYRDLLSLKQSMFLYRNMQYILQNKGKQGNLKYLENSLLPETGILLRSKVVTQNSEDSIVNCRTIPEILSEEYDTYPTPNKSMNNGIESVDRIIQKEYMEGLEPIYNKSIVKTQTDILAKGGQTYLMTKLIELTEGNQYRYSINMHFRYMLDSIFARLSYGDLDYNVIVDTPDGSTSILLNISEAVALMYYCVMRINPQRVFLTEKNIKEFYNEYIYYHDKLILLTETNASKYINKYVDIRVPVTIPDSVYLKYAFKENLDESMIPNEFYYLGERHKTFDYIDKEKMITMFKKDEPVLDTDKRLITYLGKGIRNLLSYNDMMYSTFDRVKHEAEYVSLHSLLNESKVQLNLVPNYSDYETWFTSYPELGRAIRIINSKSDAGEIYNAYLKNIVASILGPSASKALRSALYGNKFIELKELLTQLCSYTIAFLTTGANDNYSYLNINAKMFPSRVYKHTGMSYHQRPPWVVDFSSTGTDNVDMHMGIEPAPNRFVYHGIDVARKHLDRKMLVELNAISNTYMCNYYKQEITEEEA